MARGGFPSMRPTSCPSSWAEASTIQDAYPEAAQAGWPDWSRQGTGRR